VSHRNTHIGQTRTPENPEGMGEKEGKGQKEARTYPRVQKGVRKLLDISVGKGM